ncbi:MAG: hypothetical protein FJ191_04970 [Gammaproteobacteria bacterium]|nr:hypothetical protein [Gammaproteobacteria bacterium]
MRIGQVGAVALGGLLVAAAVAEEKMFEPPMHAGYRVDICRVWGSECGQPAADEFCRLQGFERADFFMVDNDIGAATPTRILADGKVCDQGFCDGFGAIHCVRADAAPQGSTTPATQPGRTGRLKMPGWSSGPATSPNEQPPPPPPAASPPAAPSPAEQPTGPPWTPKDVMDSRIDVQGQYALFRLLKGDPVQRIDASNLLSAVKAGALKGIYQEDQQVPAMRAVELGKWWGQLLPKEVDGVCLTEPAGKPPIIAMRRGTPPDKARYDAALVTAWRQCGIAPIWPLRPYDPSATPGDPPGTSVFKCSGPDDEIRLRAMCEYKQTYDMIGCDIAGEVGAVVLYGTPVHGYEECAERVGEILESCNEAVAKMCGK